MRQIPSGAATAGSPTSGGAHRRSLAAFFSGLVLWQLITYVLLPIPVVRDGVDDSWRAFLTWAFEHGRQFGTEVVFTYGPWGFLLEPRGTASVYFAQIAGRLVLSLGTAAGLALLGVSWIRSAVRRRIWAFSILLLAEPAALIPVLLLLCTGPRAPAPSRRNLPLLLLAISAGLVGCTKGTYFVTVACLLPVLLLRRATAPLAFAAGASFLAFWLLARQQLANVVPFVVNSLHISTGYAAAMARSRPTPEFVFLALLICGLPLWVLARLAFTERGLLSIVRLGWLTVCQFLIYQHALIRYDPEHSFMAFFSLGLPVILLAAVLPGAFPSGRSAGKPVFAVLAALAMVSSIPAVYPAVLNRTFVFLGAMSGYPESLASLFRPMQPAQPAAGRGAIDVFATDLSYPILRNLPLRNRPVIQAYSAYSPYLSQLNATFLEGPAAPDSIYFHVSPIDDHFPSMEDSLSWRSLLTRYHPSASADGFLILARRPRPARPSLRLLLDTSLAAGQTLDVPASAGGLIWAELQPRRTLAGRIFGTLYRRGKLTLDIQAAGQPLSFPLLDENAAGGFLLSPYIDSPNAMTAAYRDAAGQPAGKSVERIRISLGSAFAWEYERGFAVRFYSLELHD